MTWARMPSGIVDGFARAMERLQAEEALHVIEQGTLSAGRLDRETAQPIIDRYVRMTERHERRPHQPQSREQLEGMLAQLGIPLVIENG